jgi:hypothetical protein
MSDIDARLAIAEAAIEVTDAAAYSLACWMAVHHRSELMQMRSLESEAVHKNPDVDEAGVLKSQVLIAVITRALDETEPAAIAGG